MIQNIRQIKRTIKGKIHKASIISINITIENDSFLSCWIFFSYNKNYVQGFGGFVLGGYPDCKSRDHNKANFAGEYIMSVFQIFDDIKSFKEMEGKSARILIDAESNYIVAIGHHKKDKWFSPKNTFEKMKLNHK